jgi:hypothetical protein
MVKDGGALARAASIGPRAATGVSADAAGGIPRYGITRRAGNNDLRRWCRQHRRQGRAREVLVAGVDGF